MLNHTYSFNEIVIGNTYESLKHAHLQSCHHILNAKPQIFWLDKIGDQSKEDLWANLSHQHALKGLAPFTDKVKAIRFEDTNLIKITTFNERLFTVRYKQCYIYDLDNVSGVFEEYKTKSSFYHVYDWFDVHSGMRHGHTLLEDNRSDFVQKIYFYVSTRIDGNKEGKDLVSYSKLTHDQLSSADYSDAIVKLKTIKMMQENGIIKPSLNLWKREVFPIKERVQDKKNNVVYIQS